MKSTTVRIAMNRRGSKLSAKCLNHTRKTKKNSASVTLRFKTIVKKLNNNRGLNQYVNVSTTPGKQIGNH